MNALKAFFSQRKLLVLTIALFSAASFLGGLYVGYLNIPEVQKITGLDPHLETASVADAADLSPLWKAWNILNEKYVATKHGTTTKALTNQDKVWGAIEGLTASLGDPYTVFFPPEESKDFNSEISGTLEGVGMEVGLRDKVITVIAPIKNSPAEKAGIRTGDKVLKIDGLSTSNLSVDEAVRKIRGQKGTKVTLNLYRVGKKEPFDISVIRDVINIPTLDTKLRPDGVFVIRLYSFTSMSPDLFRNALQEFAQSKSNKLIIDLRGNPGGYLEAAVDMASWFLPSGKVIVQEDFGPGKDAEVYRSKGYNIFNDNLKLAILINEGSASASEILAGALHEQGKAILIGEQSFGKGSVQELVPITETTSLKVTVARWLTPNGNTISENGLIPDFVVDLTADDIEKGKDPQLDAAVKKLLGK